MTYTLQQRMAWLEYVAMAPDKTVINIAFCAVCGYDEMVPFNPTEEYLCIQCSIWAKKIARDVCGVVFPSVRGGQ